MQITLTPFSKAKTELKDLIAPTVITEGQINKEILAENKVIILGNVAKLENNKIQLLREFVNQGGRASRHRRRQD